MKKKKRKIQAMSDIEKEESVDVATDSYRVEVLLAVLLLFLSVIRFAGWFQDAEVPGWDAPGHFYAFSRLATDLLPHGQVTAYVTEWLGGISLFRFYAPLWFVLAAAFWFVTFKLMPLTLVFRLAAFATLLAVPTGLWFASWAFFGRRTARWVLALAPIYLFFPKLYSSLGPGGGGVFWVGLIPSAFGMAFFLAALAALEFWRQKPHSRLWAVSFAVLIGAIACGHTVSLIIGTGIIGVYGLCHWRERHFLLRAAVAYLVGIGLSAWWLVPFFSGNYLTAAEVRYSTGGRSLLTSLFPVDFRMLGLVVVVVVLLVLGGAVAAWKIKRRDWLLMLAAVTFIMLTRVLWAGLFPDLTIHYERFAIFIYVFAWALAALAIERLWSGWADGTLRRRVYLLMLMAVIAGAYLLAFDWKPKLTDPGESLTVPMQWTWSEYPAADEGEAIVEFLGRQTDVQRVMAHVPRAEATYLLGAHQYFSVRLATANSQESVSGLLMESSPLVPFLNPTIEALAGWDGEKHGDMRLRLVAPYRTQPWSLHLDRLRFLGVSHVIATKGTSMESNLAVSSSVIRLFETENFSVYRLRDTEKTAYSVSRPMCFFNLDGRLAFRDLSFALWTGEKTYGLPVVWIKDEPVSEAVLENADCGTVIVSARRVSDETANTIKGGDRTLVVIGGEGGDRNIPEFEHIPLARKEQYEEWPVGWVELRDAVLSVDHGDITGAESAAEFAGNSLTVDGGGPVVLRYSYSPYWQSSGDESARMAAPAFTYIPGDGRREFSYRPGSDKSFGVILSVASIMAIVGWLGVISRRRES